MSTGRSRARNYWPKVMSPDDGGTQTDSREALREGWNWILSELKEMDRYRPDDGEAARWHVAFQLGRLAESMPRRTKEKEPR